MQISIKVADLYCPHCAKAIEMFCKAVPYVEHVQYLEDLHRVMITGSSDLRAEWLKLAIEEAGYQVEGLEVFTHTDGGEFA